MPYSRELARFIGDFSLDNAGDGTVLKTKHCFVDWLGAVFNSSDSPLAESYVEFATSMGGSGPISILGRNRNTALPWAAFANACLGHVTEVDDGHRMSIMHIGTVVLPTVFAYAEKFASSGREMLEAAICGYDLAIRVGECLGKDHYTTWHTTATAGTFGSAAAAAKMLGLDEDQIVWTLGHAGTQAAGLWQFLVDGAVSAKAFHPGKAVFNGILSAELAFRGIEGAEHIFEGEKGLCSAMSPECNLTLLTENLGQKYKVDEVNFKGYPTCGQTHSMLDGLKKIMASRAIAPEDIEKIEARVYRKAIDVAGIRDPRSLEEAKFSNYFCMAALIAKGDITFDNLSSQDLDSPVIRDLMSRIELIYDPEKEKLFPATRPCSISVTLKDGTLLEAENRFRRGDPENPMSKEDVSDKFYQLTCRYLGKQEGETILALVYDMEKRETYRGLL